MKSSLTVLFLSLCWSALFLVVGVFGGWITLYYFPPWLMDPAAFVFRHLRMSIVPFGLLFLLYAYLVIKMKDLMRGRSKLSDLTYYDRLLNTTISCFFGVGVIWTAVGMESALMHALEGVKEGESSVVTLSAWGLLDRLVNGGLLLALSTTVFGGICGYILRLLKVILIGRDWDRFVLEEVNEHGQVGLAEG